MKAKVLSGEEVLGVFALRHGDYIVGSSPSAHLQIESDSVALEHARLRVGPHGVEVEDLKSGRDTYLGGLPIVGPHPVRSGSSIRLGNVAVEFLDEDVPPGALNDEDGRYVLGEIVNEGNMGKIWRAHETTTGREVAMKRMHEELESDAELIARFVTEARITAHLEHPNVVPVHDVNPGSDGSRYYTMKMVHGASLEAVFDLLREPAGETLSTYSLEALLTIFQKVCDAVAFAHSKGVIHRDLKPANIMVGEYGEVLVMDWGLAKLVGEAAGELIAKNSAPFAGHRGGGTMRGTLLGTAHYMPPEQARGEIESLDERSDVYALGAILYELLTLQKPVDAESVPEVLAKVRAGKITPPLERVGASLLPHLPGGTIPASLAAVAMKALSFTPERRYQRVPELQADISAFQSGFAPGAEEAGALRQFTLFIKRNKRVSAVIAASLVFLAGISALYTVNLRMERNNLRESEKRERASNEEAQTSAEQARIDRNFAMESAQKAQDQTKFALASAKEAKLAQASAENALQGQIAAQILFGIAIVEKDHANVGKKVAETDAKNSAKAAAEAIRIAEEVRKTKFTKRIVELGKETDPAAESGSAGTVLINSVFLLGQETAKGLAADPKQLTLHQRRIRAALQQIPRLCYLSTSATLARISPDGFRVAFFAGGNGQTYEVNSTYFRPMGNINLGGNSRADVVEFGGKENRLLIAGTNGSGQPDVWLWDLATAKEHPNINHWRFGGPLERFLPYPDRSKVVTIHSDNGPNPEKEIRLWDLDRATVATGKFRITGAVWSLVPPPRSSYFLLQSFPTLAAEQAGYIYRVDPDQKNLLIKPLKDAKEAKLRRAVTISPDGQRLVQLVNPAQLSLAAGPRPDGGRGGTMPPVLRFSAGSDSRGVELKSLSGERQEFVNAASGERLGAELKGGESTFSPDSQWLLMGAGNLAFLHRSLDNGSDRGFQMALPGNASLLAFSGDSTRAMVASTGAQVSLWSAKNGRRVCPDILLHSEPAEISTDNEGRYVLTSGKFVSLWDTKPLRTTRGDITFSALSPTAVWVCGDGRRAVAIPPGIGDLNAPPQPTGGASMAFLTVHELEGKGNDPHGRTFMKRGDVPPGSTFWLTRNGRFFLVWGGNEQAIVWNLEKEKRSARDIFPKPTPQHRKPEYKLFYEGRNIVVAESRNPNDTSLGLVVEGAKSNDNPATRLLFDGVTGKDLSKMAEVTLEAGKERVADIDGQDTLTKARNRLARDLPKNALRAFFSADEKLVAVLCTSILEEAIERPVISSLLFDSDMIGRTDEQRSREGRYFGFNPLKGRTWRLHVYDVDTGQAILGDFALPDLAAFRWEGARCIALSSEGKWTEIDVSPEVRPLNDLRDAAYVLTGRAIDAGNAEITHGTEPISTLVQKWGRLRGTFGADWQVNMRAIPK